MDIQEAKTKPPRLFSRGGSALNLIIGISMHGIIVSIVVSHCKQKSDPLGATEFIWGIFRCFLSFEYSKTKDKDPVVVLGGWL